MLAPGTDSHPLECELQMCLMDQKGTVQDTVENHNEAQ